MQPPPVNPVPFSGGATLHLPCIRCGRDLRAESIKGTCPGCGLLVASSVRVGGGGAERARACRGCGYSLRGLGEVERCPECGLEVAGGSIPDEPLSHMPRPFVVAMARRTTLGFVCLGLGAGAQAAAAFNTAVPLAIIILVILFAVFQVIAAWVLTIPVLEPQGLLYGMDERATCRRASRWGSLLWPAWACMVVSLQLEGVVSAVLGSSVLAGAVFGGLAVMSGAALLASAALSWWMRGVAQWVRDDRAETILNWSAFSFGITGIVLAVTLFLGWLQTPLVLIGLATPFLLLVGVGGQVIGAGMVATGARQSIGHADERQERVDAGLRRQDEFDQEIAETIRGMQDQPRPPTWGR